MLKLSLLFILFLNIQICSGQLSQNSGTIEVQVKPYHYKTNNKGKLLRKTYNKHGRPNRINFFDPKGKILKKIGFGKQHNADLKLMDFIEVFSYNEVDSLKSILEYESDYEKNVFPNWFTKVNYDLKQNQRIDSIIEVSNNSVFRIIKNEFDINHNNIRTSFSDKTTYERGFDDKNRLIFLKQFVDNRMRWQWIYQYEDSKRIGEFTTFYNDGKDYKKVEIKLIENNQLKMIEEKPKGTEGIFSKIIFHYSKTGNLEKIERFISYSNPENYKLRSYVTVKIKGIKDNNKNVYRIINSTVIEDELK